MNSGMAQAGSADGKTIFKVLQDGDFFGEVALLTSHSRRTANVRALKQCG